MNSPKFMNHLGMVYTVYTTHSDFGDGLLLGLPHYFLKVTFFVLAIVQISNHSHFKLSRFLSVSHAMLKTIIPSLRPPWLPLHMQPGLAAWPAGSEKFSGAEQSIRLLKGAYRACMLPAAAGYYFLIYHAYMNILDLPSRCY